MPVAFVEVPPPAVCNHPLTEKDAVDIWIARWLRVRRADLLKRYNCDPRRLYEIWEGARYPASRERALRIFAERYPTLLDQVDMSRHRRLPLRATSPDQLRLFD
jgi:hypothetical protein